MAADPPYMESVQQTAPLFAELVAHPPAETLYHYTSAEALLRIVDSGTIYATDARFLNDSREVRHALQLADVRLRSEAWRMRGYAGLVHSYLAEQLERLEYPYVCLFSLSEDGNLLSQWRAYCPAEGGYALGFDALDLRLRVLSEGCFMSPCVYDLPLQKALVDEALEPVIAAVTAAPRNEKSPEELGEALVNGLFSRILRIAPLLKDPAFREEREWRVVWISTPATASRLRYRASDASIVPFLPIPMIGGDGPTVLNCVMVGPMRFQREAMMTLPGVFGTSKVRTRQITASLIPYRSR